MNVARVAELLRALADELESDGEPHAEPRPVLEPPRRAVARTFPRPLQEVSETDRMRAMKMLRKRGMGT
jgi:hypothetical protein